MVISTIWFLIGMIGGYYLKVIQNYLELNIGVNK